ncbi:MAG: hypothetical protein OXE43_13875 [Chloroflexi bacterium]|nr:hypothetical protein [Chloroflexota bacterium]
MSERRWDRCVRDMLDCCGKVRGYAAGRDRAALFTNDLVYEAAHARADLPLSSP